jgi:hypothetical protein
MMSERQASIEKTVEITLGWTEIFQAAKKLVEQTESDDVRWVHVQKAKAVYDEMRSLYDAHKFPESEDAGGAEHLDFAKRNAAACRVCRCSPRSTADKRKRPWATR